MLAVRFSIEITRKEHPGPEIRTRTRMLAINTRLTEKFSVSKGKGFHAGEKLAISLVDRDGATEVCVSASRFASSRNGNFVQMERSGWNGKSGVPPKVVRLFRKFSI